MQKKDRAEGANERNRPQISGRKAVQPCSDEKSLDRGFNDCLENTVTARKITSDEESRVKTARNQTQHCSCSRYTETNLHQQSHHPRPNRKISRKQRHQCQYCVKSTFMKKTNHKASQKLAQRNKNTTSGQFPAPSCVDIFSFEALGVLIG